MLETKIPNLIYLNFQLSVQEPREQFHKNGRVRRLLSFSFFSGDTSRIFHVVNKSVAEFTSCVSNSELKVSDCCAQMLESIMQF